MSTTPTAAQVQATHPNIYKVYVQCARRWAAQAGITEQEAMRRLLAGHYALPALALAHLEQTIAATAPTELEALLAEAATNQARYAQAQQQATELVAKQFPTVYERVKLLADREAQSAEKLHTACADMLLHFEYDQLVELERHLQREPATTTMAAFDALDTRTAEERTLLQ